MAVKIVWTLVPAVCLDAAEFGKVGDLDPQKSPKAQATLRCLGHFVCMLKSQFWGTHYCSPCHQSETLYGKQSPKLTCDSSQLAASSTCCSANRAVVP